MFNISPRTCPTVAETDMWLPDFWKSRQDALVSRGYEIREPQPYWGSKYVTCPKSHQDTAQCFILIAARARDSERVMIERLGSRSQSFLVQTKLPRDSWNHCVPVYDSFADPLEPGAWSYIVTPVRERHISMVLHRVKDIVILLNQLLEGLVFLHENGITRCRHCIPWQVSCDSRHWITENRKWWQSSFRKDEPTPVFYFDSLCHPYGEINEDTREDPHPSENHDFDPNFLQMDVSCFAEMVRECSYLGISNVEFVIPLLRAMSNRTVDARGALKMWESIRGQLVPHDLNKTLVFGWHGDESMTA